MSRLPPLNWLRAFEASASALSFTEAAQALHMTQSAVSQQIKALESALGRPLFMRRARGLELTAAGRSYLPTVQAAFAMLEEGTSVLTGRKNPGILEVHANLSFSIFWLAPRLHRFMEAYPWVQMNVVTSIWSEDRQSPTAAVEIVLGLGKWERRVGQRLWEDTTYPVCAPAVAQRIHSLQDLLQERLLDLSSSVQSWDSWLEAHPDYDSSAQPPVVHRASTWALSLTWAQQGLGVALAHDTVASHLIETGQLVRPFALSLPMKEAYYLIASEGTGTSAAAQAFTSWLMQEVRHPSALPQLPTADELALSAAP